MVILKEKTTLFEEYRIHADRCVDNEYVDDINVTVNNLGTKHHSRNVSKNHAHYLLSTYSLLTRQIIC